MNSSLDDLPFPVSTSS